MVEFESETQAYALDKFGTHDSSTHLIIANSFNMNINNSLLFAFKYNTAAPRFLYVPILRLSADL